MRISDWSSDVCSSDLLGNAGWSWNEVLPYFKRSEDHYQGGDECHGSGGEWRVEAQRLSWEILDAFRAAAAECGIPPTKESNRGNNAGCGNFSVNRTEELRVGHTLFSNVQYR